MNSSYVTVFHFFFYVCMHGLTKATDFKLEEDLRTLLFVNTTHNVMTRPSTPVKVNSTLYLYTMNKLDIKTESMTSSLFIVLNWNDERLKWNSVSDYSSISSINVKEKDIWVPKVTVVNSINKLSVLHDEDIILTVAANGNVDWPTGNIQKTHCKCDVTYYPFDTQTCEIDIMNWGNSVSELELNFSQLEFSTLLYSENGEWEFLGYFAQIRDIDSSGYIVRIISYFLTFRRRPLFHFINAVLPVTLLSILTCVIFKVPADSGEKIGFCLTILLAFAVYLTMVSDQMPSTSLQTSTLSVYLLIIFALCVSSVLVTLFVLQCYHAEYSKPIPDWLIAITKHLLMPLTCAKGSCEIWRCRKSQKKKNVIDVKEEKREDDYGDVIHNNIQLSWREIGKMVDACGFIACLFCTVFATILSYSIFTYGYIKQ